jgi:hypothetical protein
MTAKIYVTFVLLAQAAPACSYLADVRLACAPTAWRLQSRVSTDRLWTASAIAMSTGVALDIASSFGHPEATALYRSADGRFGNRGLAIRAGIPAAALIGQHFILRTDPPRWVRRLFAAVNFGAGASSAVQAGRNWRME